MSEELQPISYTGITGALKALNGGSWDFDPSPLAGRRLTGVEVAGEDKDELIFRFEDGFVTYRTQGDCCSYSWVEHLTVPEGISGAEITHWSEQEMGEKVVDWETIRVYQTAFRTDKGEIIVEYRNSSNGYYGGWLGGPVAQEPKR